jgi:GDP-L-fucose synthase
VIAMQRGSGIYVAGGRTMIGSAIVRRLEAEGHAPIPADEEPDYRDPAAVERFLARHRPEYVFIAAGETAGIAGNTARPADLMTDNLLAAAHLIPAAAGSGVGRLVYLASSCIYPKHAPHPLQTSSLWSGPMEPTSAAYATAKLAGVVLCHAFRRQHARPFVAAIAADAYGPGDDFSAENAHVVGALIRRFDEAARAGAPLVDVWGSGAPRREFIYVDDLADACVFAIDHYDGAEPINLGTGVDTSIAELARAIAAVVGYRGEIRFDRSKPDGMPFKGLDSSVLRGLGWSPSWTLARGLEETFRWYLSRRAGHER